MDTKQAGPASNYSNPEVSAALDDARVLLADLAKATVAVDKVQGYRVGESTPERTRAAKLGGKASLYIGRARAIGDTRTIA